MANALTAAERQLILQESSLEELIPHSPPMVLLSKVVDISDDSLTAELALSEDSLFYDPLHKAVPSWVGIEYMAQAIAAFAGARAKLIGEPVKLGFLLGTRKYDMPKAFLPAGHVYQVVARQLYMDESGLASFHCEILLDNEPCAVAKLNVFETDDVSKVTEK